MQITGVDIDTLMKLLVRAGEKCEKVMGRLIVNVPVGYLECDEIRSYVRKEESQDPDEADDDSMGDAYCFVAMGRTSKLVLNFALGRRTQATTDAFIESLRATTSPQRFQISTDRFQPYQSPITTTLSDRCDFAQIIEVYTNADREGQRCYNPADASYTERVPVMGNPYPERICTSHIERQNLTIRMGMRRLTRLTNAFSKKWDNLWPAYWLHFAYYNFCRIHKTLRATPAMEAGITDRVWRLADLLA
jgi:IS1 family transposase